MIISLEQWYFKNTKIPVWIILFIIISTQIVYLYFINIEQKEKEIEITNTIRDVLIVGIEQKNRVLVESTLILN